MKIRLWRPFPFDDLKKAVLHAKQLVVIDRAISVGACGPVASEVKAALYGKTRDHRCIISSQGFQEGM